LSAYRSRYGSYATYPDWKEGYIGAAKSCLALGDYRRTIAFANIALGIPAPHTPASVEAMNKDFNPVFIRGVAQEYQGKIAESYQRLQTARKIWNPPNGSLDEKIQIFDQRKEEDF